MEDFEGFVISVEGFPKSFEGFAKSVEGFSRRRERKSRFDPQTHFLADRFSSLFLTAGRAMAMLRGYYRFVLTDTDIHYIVGLLSRAAAPDGVEVELGSRVTIKRPRRRNAMLTSR